MAIDRDSYGRIVARSFMPGYILLSYLVSFVGAWTTLELLHRRTAERGLYNWYLGALRHAVKNYIDVLNFFPRYLLVGSSISMGGVAIWCMHFIGNRAILLGDGDPEIQINYDAGYTALSFFLPILVLLPAFVTTGSHDRVRKARVTLGGILAGLAICGMHYLGQLGIRNYISVYKPAYVVASAVIAILASVTALSIFSVLQAAWTNSWWRRSLCAILLASAVSGMHWLASVGTNYRSKEEDGPSELNLTTKETVIVVIVLSVVACLMLSAFAFVAQLRRQHSAVRAQQLVLACAIFDARGRLLVSPDGSLPSQKITNTYIEQSINDVFNVSHPVFQWAFRVSRNWTAVVDLVPCMRHHLHSGANPVSTRRLRHRTCSQSHSDGAADQGSEDYLVTLKELFCVAAADLASHVGEHLEEMGVLYDDIMTTGMTRSIRPKAFAKRFFSAKTRSSDLELGISSCRLAEFGRGQLLFLIRRANKQDATRLQAKGFRFTALEHVCEILAKELQVRAEMMMGRLQTMRDYAGIERVLEPGVHLACFAIRAGVTGGFHVLVRQAARNRLPTRRLPLNHVEDWQLGILRQMHGWTVAECLDRLQDQATSVKGKELQIFVTQLRDALLDLVEEVADPVFQQAILVSTPIQVPRRMAGDGGAPGRAQLIAFQIIVPIHSRAASNRHTFLPLSFFRCQQYVYDNASDHEVFARRLKREFAPIVDMTTQSTVVYRPVAVTTRGATSAHPDHHQSKRRPSLSGDTVSAQKRAWWNPTHPRSNREKRRSGQWTTAVSEKALEDGSNCKGILVREEINVNVEVNGATQVVDSEGPVVLKDVVEDRHEDEETFVDLLFASCFEGKRGM